MSQEDHTRENAVDKPAEDPVESRAEESAEKSAATGDEPTEDTRPREELVAALDDAEARRDEYLEALQRTQAEFQNFRKRSMREGATQRESGTTEVLAKLIDVVDDFELAVVAVESNADPERVRKGVEMVYGKLIEALRSFGLEKIGQEGVPFDPELHDAVQQVDSDGAHDEPIVVEVLRPGYAVGERVIRAAMVKVAR